MSAIQFQRGQFRTYRATEKIHLGKYETDILKDDFFDYDGSSVRYSGMEYGVPQLRGLAGAWFVSASDNTTTYKAQPAGVVVSHATPEARERGDTFSMEEASEEEAVVGTMTEQKQIREAAGRGDQDRLASLREARAARSRRIAGGTGEVSLDSNPDAPPPPNATDIDPMVEAALMERAIPQDNIHYQQARPVHSTGNAPHVSGEDNVAVSRANAVNLERIASEAERLDRVDPRKSREEMGGQRHMTADFQGGTKRVGVGGKYALIQDDSSGGVVKTYKFSEGATVGDGVVEAGEVKSTNVLRAPSTHPVQVGNAVATTPNRHAGAQVISDPMTTHEPQGVRARSTTQVPRRGNVGIDEISDNGATGDVDRAYAGDDLESLLPGAAVAGRIVKKAPPAPQPTEAEEIGEVLEGWNTRRNWQKRVDEAVEFYGDWPEALDAICAKESPNVAKQIRSKMARLEAGEKA